MKKDSTIRGTDQITVLLISMQKTMVRNVPLKTDLCGNEFTVKKNLMHMPLCISHTGSSIYRVLLKRMQQVTFFTNVCQWISYVCLHLNFIFNVNLSRKSQLILICS